MGTNLLVKLLVMVVSFVVACFCARHLYAVKYPPPGQRPSLLAARLVAPAAIVGILAITAGIASIGALLK
jgi:hypothetical protein